LSRIAHCVQKRENKVLRLQIAFKFRSISGIERSGLFSHSEGGAWHGCLAEREGYLCPAPCIWKANKPRKNAAWLELFLVSRKQK
jgi:hypothetical protein